MHRKYGSQGLVCVSASVDPLEQKQAALNFLTKNQADFANFLLDEEQEFWQDKFRINGPPCVFVFDRSGRRAARFSADDEKPHSYADIEKVVSELLRASR